MRVIVIGASGPVGQAILRGVAEHPEVTHVVSLSEEAGIPDGSHSDDGTPIEGRTVDLGDDLSSHLQFADAVIYAGWPVSEVLGGHKDHQIQALTNVCESVGEAGVRTFIYCSSAGVYSPSPEGSTIDESWPTLGATSSPTALQMVRGERVVGQFEDVHSVVRVVRLRAGVIIGARAERERGGRRTAKIVRAMTDPRRRWRFVPDLGPYVIQCVHIDDFVHALGQALVQSVRGCFNIAAEPITSDVLAEVMGAKKIRIDPLRAVRLLTLASHLRLLSRPVDWAELAIRPQVMDTTRAQGELGWTAGHSARSMVVEWIGSLPSGRDHAVARDTLPAVTPAPELTEMDLGALYLRSLTHFGEVVHAIEDDQWEVTTDGDQRVWQVVASVALAQYRVALAARGADDATIESQLPGDPLGISRPDGWDLAAERGELAVARPDDAPAQLSNVSKQRLGHLLPGVIVDTVQGASQLGQALGLHREVPPELSRFTDRMDRPPVDVGGPGALS